MPLLGLLFSASVLAAQPGKAAPAPDFVLFVNGERLTGTLEKVDNKEITFKSVMAGEVTIPWTNIQELHSTQTFALLKKHQTLDRRSALAEVPSGAVSEENKELTLKSPTTTTTLPVADLDRLIPSAEFNKALAPVHLTQGWEGTAGGGVSLVRATENATTFNGTVALTRGLPQVDWLPARSRTSIDYTQSYGTNSQAGVPTVKTNIFHASGEQDVYFSPRAFILADATFDHNFSQNLDLQQIYGAGIGLNLIKNATQTLDLKASLQYEKQTFFLPAVIDNIFGATFSETYLRNLPRKIVFSEFGSISPAFNTPSAFSSHINASLGFPVYKNLSFTVSAIDDYLNNAPAVANQNSSQFTTNITYTIKPR